MTKTSTDVFWNERARSVAQDHEVNIMDVFQRELELEQVRRWLSPHLRVLEVGCGNGYSTDCFRKCVAHIDAFDYAEEMIARAKKNFGETNNRFLHDNLLAPDRITTTYDAVICIRVLINLRDLQEQRSAVDRLANFVNEEGTLILVEGFTDGFMALNRLRSELGMPPLEPASINAYCAIAELMPMLLHYFEPVDQFHLGSYDYHTRVVYPLVAGPENVRHNTVFSEKAAELARRFNPDCFEEFSRIRGVLLKKRRR